MNNQIKARGWIWDRSENFTQWKLYKCMRCGYEYTYPHNHVVRACRRCKSVNTVSIAYVRRVKQVQE